MFEWLRKLWADRKVETRIRRDGVSSPAERALIDERWKLIQARLQQNGTETPTGPRRMVAK